MTQVQRPHFTVLMIAALIVTTSCTDDPSTSTGPQAAPATPATPSVPPLPFTPSADSRRSFIWSAENGFTILPNPPGAILVSANAINDRGEVAGTVILAGVDNVYRAFKWSAATGYRFIPLETINSYGRGLDEDGSVLSFTEAGSDRNAILWSDSKGVIALNIRLPFLNVLGMKDGSIFGTSMSVDSRSGYNRVSAYRLDMASGRYEELQTSSEIGGGVLQVNGFGDAAGFDGYMDHGFGGTSDGVVWDAAGKRTVAYACNGEWNCFAYLKAINAKGMGAGSVTRGESRTMKAFRWSSEGGVEFLTDPSGVTSGLDVVGMTEDGDILAFNDMIAFIVKPNGHATLVAPPPNYRIVRPVAMNRNGQVVGMLF